MSLGQLAAMEQELAAKYFSQTLDWSAAQVLQALVGEVGEYANIRKKYERGDLSYKQFYDAARLELADIQIYLMKLANILNIDMSESLTDKIAIIRGRFDK